jgi:hypothetical protein
MTPGFARCVNLVCECVFSAPNAARGSQGYTGAQRSAAVNAVCTAFARIMGALPSGHRHFPAARLLERLPMSLMGGGIRCQPTSWTTGYSAYDRCKT